MSAVSNAGLSKKGHFFTYMILIMTMILWSSSFIGLKLGLSVFTPFEVMALRMMSASLFCLPYAKEVWQIFKNKKYRTILVLGVLFEPCLYFLCETFALHYTTASQAGMVVALAPLFIGLGAWIWLKEKLEPRMWFGFFVAVVGIVWLSVTGEQSQSAPNPLLGNALELCAVLCAMGYTLCVRTLVQHIPPAVFTAAMAFAGSLFFLPLCLIPVEITPVELGFEIPTWLPLVAIVYLGLAVSLIGYGGYNYALSRLPASRVAPYLNLIPIITMFMGVVLLKEQLVFSQYIASALVIFGIVISQSSQTKEL